jgi:hypothetical protein
MMLAKGLITAARRLLASEMVWTYNQTDLRLLRFEVSEIKRSAKSGFARNGRATTILLTASGIEGYEILANRMGCLLRLRPRKRLIAGDRFVLFTSALIRLASIENASPPTIPAPMHIATMPSNTRRRASLSRKRSFRARQNAE